MNEVEAVAGFIGWIVGAAFVAALIGIPLYRFMRWRNPAPMKRNRQKLVAGLVACTLSGFLAAMGLAQ